MLRSVGFATAAVQSQDLLESLTAFHREKPSEGDAKLVPLSPAQLADAAGHSCSRIPSPGRLVMAAS